MNADSRVAKLPVPNVEATMRRLLEEVGADLSDPHLAETPQRAARALTQELLIGYRTDPARLFKTFEESHDETVILRNIPFYSLCAHHLLPFHGTASIAYKPAGRVLGLSKMARLVDCFSRRLQVQERLTNQIAQSLERHLEPLGIVVMLRAEHLCMAMRGVGARGTETLTYAITGKFRESQNECDRILNLFCDDSKDR